MKMKAPQEISAGARSHTQSRNMPKPDYTNFAPIIYFNIGWMRDYKGPVVDDRTIGAHGHLREHWHGGECFNFVPTGKRTVRGYRPPGSHEETNITRMGARGSDSEISGALAVWLAKEPGTNRTLIVGWYQNATIFRKARARGIILNGQQVDYTAETKIEDAILLPPLSRTFEVRSSRVLPGSGFGQKPTWYGVPEINERVRKYISNYAEIRTAARALTVPNGKRSPRNTDPELRRKVEKAAVQHAIDYYKSEFGKSCIVESVESDAKGWDLEVQFGNETLLIEVKGLLNSDLICELTSNEYEKMMLPEYSAQYIVYVVNNALAAPPAIPVASIFKHTADGKWFTDDGRELLIRQKIAAVLSCR